MQIVIEISEDNYKEVKEDTFSGTPFENRVFSTMANGTPLNDILDKIRAEIKEHADRLRDSLYGDGMRHCIDIIDKYREESEDADSN